MQKVLIKYINKRYFIYQIVRVDGRLHFLILSGTALCRGDSGGGLAFPAMELGVDRYYLRGIVSVALSSENLCNAHTYTLFTKITKFVDLIRSIPRNHF